MIYLNLKTATLRSPEYIGTEPTGRATWLNLLCYCCEQENGGVIPGCEGWKDRQWQQTCGVTLAEVREECGLWAWQGSDLAVAFYPADKQAEVQAKRQAGSRGGKRSGIARREAVNEAQLQAVGEAELQAQLQRKGMEGNRKGMEESETRAETVWLEPSSEQVVEAGRRVGLTPEQATIWLNDHLARPITPTGQWTGRDGKPINNWQAALSAWAGRWKENDRNRSTAKRGNQPANNGRKWQL